MGGWSSRALVSSLRGWLRPKNVKDLVGDVLPPALCDLVMRYVSIGPHVTILYPSRSLIWLGDDTLISTSYARFQLAGHNIESWDVKRKTMVWYLRRDDELVCAPILLDNGLWATATLFDITVWTEGGQLVSSIHLDSEHVFSLIASLRNGCIVAYLQGYHIMIYDSLGVHIMQIKEWRSVSTLITHEDRIIVGCYDGWVHMWEPDASVPKMKAFQAHDMAITSLCAHNGLLYSGSEDCTVRVWSNDFMTYHVFTGHSSKITNIIPFKHGVASSSKEAIYVWGLDGSRERLIGHTDDIVALSALNNKLASGSSDSIRIW